MPQKSTIQVSSVLFRERKQGRREMDYSLWDYQESILELKHKILCTNFELETARTKAKEAMIKFDDSIKQLHQLLQRVCQERDEARDQLQRLVNKVDSIDSSAVDCLFFTANSSPDLSNPNLINPSNGLVSMIDPDLAVIDNLVKGRPLPHKGRLLQTVIEAGPLLHTLLVAGPLPLWHSPPSTFPSLQKIESNSDCEILNSFCSSYHNVCHTSNLAHGIGLDVEHGGQPANGSGLQFYA
ncbi:uncharacterized protein LOC114269999 [Camellia sinensis]|uniref:uncharacterized protein LOC114269999 n=1 Tax=Camellia sinensis TaxID=4442 RepID=UPI0010355ADF|nr:uncharacterized protein LOC114269999 [Camellia sinensis]